MSRSRGSAEELLLPGRIRVLGPKVPDPSAQPQVGHGAWAIWGDWLAG
jgi:hypothetical protein